MILIYLFGGAGLATFIAGMATHSWLSFEDGNLGLWQKHNMTNLSDGEPPRVQSLTFGDCSDYVDGARSCMIVGIVTIASILISALLGEKRKDSNCLVKNLPEVLMVVLAVLGITAVSLYQCDAKECYTNKYSLSDVRLGGSYIATCVSSALIMLCFALIFYNRYQEQKSSENQVKPNVVKKDYTDKPFYENDPLAPANTPAQGPSIPEASQISQRRSSSTATSNVFTIEINNLNNRPSHESFAASTPQPQTGLPLTPHPSNASRVTPMSVGDLAVVDNPPVYTIYVNPDIMSPPPSYEDVLEQGSQYTAAPGVVMANDVTESKF